MALVVVHSREVLTTGAQLDAAGTGASFVDEMRRGGLSSPGNTGIVRRLRQYLWLLPRRY